MNAIEKRDEKIKQLGDAALLEVLVSNIDDLTDAEMNAFADMLCSGARLSERQRAWAEQAAKKVMPFAAKDVPRGREVETPAVLRNLPKAPPGRVAR